MQKYKINNHKVDVSISVSGITSLCPWKSRKTRQAYNLTGFLCEAEDQHRCMFHYGTYGNKKQVDTALQASPKVGVGNNCPMLNRQR